jgi:hypothetical protein
MQDSTTDIPYDLQKLVGIVIPVLLLGFVAIISPFAVLRNNVGPPSYPPPPGWESSVTIYLWAARFSVAFIQGEYGLGGGVTNLHTIPFVIMTFIYIVIQIAVSDRKLRATSGMAIEILLFLIWVSVCQLIYGSLQDWTLIQIPLLPIAGISFLLVVYWNQLRH